MSYRRTLYLCCRSKRGGGFGGYLQPHHRHHLSHILLLFISGQRCTAQVVRLCKMGVRCCWTKGGPPIPAHNHLKRSKEQETVAVGGGGVTAVAVCGFFRVFVSGLGGRKIGLLGVSGSFCFRSCAVSLCRYSERDLIL